MLFPPTNKEYLDSISIKKKLNISSNKPNQDMSELEESSGCKLSKYDFIELPHPTDRPPSSVVHSFIFLNIQLK